MRALRRLVGRAAHLLVCAVMALLAVWHLDDAVPFARRAPYWLFEAHAAPLLAMVVVLVGGDRRRHALAGAAAGIALVLLPPLVIGMAGDGVPSVTAVVAGAAIGALLGAVFVAIGVALAIGAEEDAPDGPDEVLARAGLGLVSLGWLAAAVAPDRATALAPAARLVVAPLGLTVSFVAAARDVRRALRLRRSLHRRAEGWVPANDPRGPLTVRHGGSERADLPPVVALRGREAEGSPYRAGGGGDLVVESDPGGALAWRRIRSRGAMTGLAVLCVGIVGVASMRGEGTRTAAVDSPPREPWPASEAVLHERPKAMPLPGPAVNLAMRDRAACAVLRSGEVACWGESRKRFSGLPDRVSRPSLLPSVRGARALALGDAHACALDANGAVRCWGEGRFGQLGDVAERDGQEPVMVKLERPALAVVALLAESCALLDDGAVWCWGYDQARAGCVGDPEPPLRRPPRPEPGFVDVEELAPGQLRFFARTRRGEVFASRASDECRVRGAHVPVPLPFPARALGTGPHGGCVLLHEGGASCWGQVRTLDRIEAVPTAEPLPALQGARAVAVGRGFTCFMRDDRRVACFGLEHGARMRSGRPTPEPVPALRDVERVVAGDSAACALRSDGTVWCWGGPVGEVDGPGESL